MIIRVNMNTVNAQANTLDPPVFIPKARLKMKKNHRLQSAATSATGKAGVTCVCFSCDFDDHEKLLSVTCVLDDDLCISLFCSKWDDWLAQSFGAEADDDDCQQQAASVHPLFTTIRESTHIMTSATRPAKSPFISLETTRQHHSFRAMTPTAAASARGTRGRVARSSSFLFTCLLCATSMHLL
jgi:hypothetical protein